MSKIICVDPGHGGSDSGAVNGSRYEKDDTLRIALLVRDNLSAQGCTVYMTRTTDEYVSLQERARIANDNKADVFISLHRNAFTNSSAKGIENWIYHGTDQTTEQFAKYVQDAVIGVKAQADRGVKKGNFYVTRETYMPACLLELGFISNDTDNQYFDQNIDEYAKAITKAICTYLNIPYNEGTTPEPPVTDDKYYRVQVGAFKDKANADRLCEELKANGYTAYVTE